MYDVSDVNAQLNLWVLVFTSHPEFVNGGALEKGRVHGRLLLWVWNDGGFEQGNKW